MNRTRHLSSNFVAKELLLALLLIISVFSSALYTYTRTLTHPTPVYAATSSTINFQARLLNASGNTVPDGFYNIQFKLYDGGTAGGPAGQGQPARG